MTAEVYKGEIQLAGWSDTHSSGAMIRIWLPDSEALANFKALTARKGNTAGQILACMITTVDYDQGLSEPATEPKEPELKGGVLARAAGMMINNPSFHDYLHETYGPSEKSGMDSADDAIKTLCQIDSKKELDHSDMAGSRFHELVRKPFVEWQSKK